MAFAFCFFLGFVFWGNYGLDFEVVFSFGFGFGSGFGCCCATAATLRSSHREPHRFFLPCRCHLQVSYCLVCVGFVFDFGLNIGVVSGRFGFGFGFGEFEVGLVGFEVGSGCFEMFFGLVFGVVFVCFGSVCLVWFGLFGLVWFGVRLVVFGLVVCRLRKGGGRLLR